MCCSDPACEEKEEAYEKELEVMAGSKIGLFEEEAARRHDEAMGIERIRSEALC